MRIKNVKPKWDWPTITVGVVIGVVATYALLSAAQTSYMTTCGNCAIDVRYSQLLWGAHVDTKLYAT